MHPDACANVSINLGAAFFWVITVLGMVVTGVLSWQASRVVHERREARELQRRIDFTNNMPYVAVDRRNPEGRGALGRFRIDPKVALMRMPRPVDKAAVEPTQFEGWRVAAE